MKQPYNTTIYNTALYMRLSRDDENYGDSVSIETQRTILQQYAKEQGLHVVGEYVDDGWSGTNFERPDFQRMMDDVEAGKVNCIVTKDLSRFGREHVMMDYYLEFLFPEKRVRYIAVAENEDTEKGLSDFVPFKNLFNEWFAKDTSRKVKAAFKAKFATGQRIGAYAPIGYRKHPEIKNKLIIDEETRWIVEKIFDLAIHGRGAASITRILIMEKVPTPGFINFQRDGTFANIYAGAPEKKSYAWTIAQVKSIMKDETYIGHTIHYRETNISFKNKRRVRKPQSEWMRVENTQEPIISEQVFRQVQEQIANRRRKCKDGTTQIFSGLVKCADCGWSLSYGENRQNSKPYGHYHCSKYGQGTRQCSMHYIRYDVLYAYVLSRLQYWSGLVQHDEERLLKQLLNATDKGQAAARKKQAAELKEKLEAQVTPASREETLERFGAIEQALSRLHSNPAVPVEKLQTIQSQLDDVRNKMQGQQQHIEDTKRISLEIYRNFKIMVDTLNSYKTDKEEVAPLPFYQRIYNKVTSWIRPGLFIFSAVLVLCSASIWLNIRLATRMQQLQDNDMKYRYLLMQGWANGEVLDMLETKFNWQRDNDFIQILTDSVIDFEYRSKKQAEALERARLLNEQAEQLRKEADKLGKP